MTRPLKHRWWGGHRWGPWRLTQMDEHQPSGRVVEISVQRRDCQVSTCRKVRVEEIHP